MAATKATFIIHQHKLALVVPHSAATVPRKEPVNQVLARAVIRMTQRHKRAYAVQIFVIIVHQPEHAW